MDLGDLILPVMPRPNETRDQETARLRLVAVLWHKFLGVTLFALVPSFLNAISFAISFAMNGNIALSMEIGSAYALQHKGDNCYTSSAVKRGEAFAVVTATGDNTFVSRAAALVSQSAGGTGHFTEVEQHLPSPRSPE
ncbi:plasma membrane H+-ATPase [Neonectria punicea]|uniref:Plasma membrane H+-ATPase n=1 Tax=Neonectria punicea TaxID=979145 RepID=A0ABR1GH53_9HYPO